VFGSDDLVKAGCLSFLRLVWYYFSLGVEMTVMEESGEQSRMFLIKEGKAINDRCVRWIMCFCLFGFVLPEAAGGYVRRGRVCESGEGGMKESSSAINTVESVLGAVGHTITDKQARTSDYETSY